MLESNWSVGTRIKKKWTNLNRSKKIHKMHLMTAINYIHRFFFFLLLFELISFIVECSREKRHSIAIYVIILNKQRQQHHLRHVFCSFLLLVFFLRFLLFFISLIAFVSYFLFFFLTWSTFFFPIVLVNATDWFIGNYFISSATFNFRLKRVQCTIRCTYKDTSFVFVAFFLNFFSYEQLTIYTYISIQIVMHSAETQKRHIIRIIFNFFFFRCCNNDPVTNSFDK